MIALSKSEILNSLEKTSIAIESICNYQSIPVISFLSDLSIVDIRVFMFISKLRYLSYYEDAFIDSIENDYNFYWRRKIELFDFLRYIYQVLKYEKNTRVLSKK